jgi:c(7)-type cytochrome triheme protein
MSFWQKIWRRRVRSLRLLVTVALTFGLAVACAEPPVEEPVAAESSAAESGTSSAVPEETTTGSSGTLESPGPGGFEAAPEVQSDADLAIDAEPPGVATVRWGDSRRDADGKSPWNSLAYDGIHARDSDAIGLLQEPRTALRALPRAISGNFVDWVEALRSGSIRPRARRGGQGQMEILDQDILLVDTKNMPVVTFPHRAHTEWLGCRNCHDWLFKAERGANQISMSDIARGRSCGLCHGKVAFPATECFRCHDGPRPKG